MSEDQNKTEVEWPPEFIERYQESRAKFLSGDTAKALQLLSELAAEGVPIAHYTLGNIYLNLDDANNKPDPEKALEFFVTAAEAGYLPAYSMLGRMYEHGYGVEKSAFRAMEYYLEGVNRLDVECLELAGQLFASGAMGEIKHDFAIPLYGSAAARGSAFAQNRLGMYYSEGKEVELDLNLASDLFKAAAVQGYEPAAYNLASMYKKENSIVDKNLDSAIQWYEVAAEKGLGPAQHNLATCYAERHASNRDLEVAAFWFNKAAEQGLRLPMESLARIYATGEGVELDLERAKYWASRAATARDPEDPAA